ncbi:MAG TPA: isoleucine--tRNA ligase [Fimbriimonadaceae bacterium]|nr:isoleucine--tRNA ligase [Fimbriimonadaceae bacterium]
MDLRASLNLPDPNFTIPMKADLPKAEPVMLQAWDNGGLYHRIQEARAGAATYVLHDGPPYTNSPIHLGTALNKILKDFVVKSHSMMGFRSPYVPGYDNHGLPIEIAVQKKLAAEKKTVSQAEMLQMCRAHAQEYADLQTKQFSRLGVHGLWEKPYMAMDFTYEAEEVRIFKRLYEAGYIYKGLRPTQWSTASQTALAETEVVYKDHTSVSIFVRFPLLHDRDQFAKGLSNVYTIVWTTTPWTIPANLAVAFNPLKEYAVVKVGDDHYIIANELVGNVAEALGWTGHKIVKVYSGAEFEYAKFKHPIFDRESLAVLADYVSMEEGTGVVHTAPGHGRDDFYTGQRYNLPTLTPVDPRGYLTAEAGEFAGTYYKNCDTVVVDRLRELGNLLDARPYVHSYPYAERDDQPVIFRATEQWFINLDHENLRERMLAEIDKVGWHPSTAKGRITAMVSGRPDWCISRQRPWGVGIPVFYGAESGEAVLDPVLMDRVADAVAEHGSGVWFAWPAERFLPEGYSHPTTGETAFRKETDVLDVWFDAGSTNLNVLGGTLYPLEWDMPWPADIYLEGSDQHRGWFNTSLILGVALKGHAPYREVLTHGFVVDDKGHKLSKRAGNAVEPVEVCEQYGADVLRYWVASVEFTADAPCYDALLKGFGEHYRNVRNAFRFLLGNLYDFVPSEAPPQLLDVDEWIIEQTDLLVDDCVAAYRRHDFGAVISGIHNFCRNELSSFYLDVIKDRMYCDGAAWPSRRSGQVACRAVLERLVKLIAPILPFTAEETWQRMRGRPSNGPLTADDVRHSVHTATFIAPTKERLEAIEASPLQQRFAALLVARSAIFTAFETWKASADVKDSQDVVVTYADSGESLDLLKSFSNEDLATMLKVSWITLEDGPCSVLFATSPHAKCERSRIRRPDVESVNGVMLSARDQAVLRERGDLAS